MQRNWNDRKIIVIAVELIIINVMKGEQQKKQHQKYEMIKNE